VLDFSKPGTPRLELLDLSVPVQEGLSLMTPTLRKAGIAVDTQFSPVSAILGDRMQLEQAVINIVDNAARAVRLHESDKTIELRIFAAENRVCLSIADNGPGIAAPDRERIFDPFYTTANDGTGIGLSIVQRIVADHQGTISVAESPQGGAEFTLEFPVPATEQS
jgi:signal transduction histidine kinase